MSLYPKDIKDFDTIWGILRDGLDHLFSIDEHHQELVSFCDLYQYVQCSLLISFLFKFYQGVSMIFAAHIQNLTLKSCISPRPCIFLIAFLLFER